MTSDDATQGANRIGPRDKVTSCDSFALLLTNLLSQVCSLVPYIRYDHYTGLENRVAVNQLLRTEVMFSILHETCAAFVDVFDCSCLPLALLVYRSCKKGSTSNV
jgi:hypothetical protein